MMTFNKRWSNRVIGSVRDDKLYINKSFEDTLLQKHVRYRLSGVNINIAIDSYLKKNLLDLKTRFSYASMVEEYCFLTFDNNWPYWNVKPYCYALLSDNTSLIDRYAHLPVDEKLLYDDPNKGMPKHFNYAIQGLLRENQALINKGLNLFQEEIDKRKEIRWKRAHIACTEAVASRDQNKIEKALLLFEDPRLKSEAIKADLCEEVLSFFPLVYAKIAWFKGIEVDPGSKYLPIDLLEVKPLEEYPIPYWFLRDFYREQGIDWRYDPVYPELQDWENDPENPDRNKGGS